MPREISRIHANVCQVFANPYRIEIIEALVKSEHTTDALAKLIGTSPSNISQHLKMMRDRQVVVSDRRGLNVFHRLMNDKLKDLFLMERELLRELMDRAADIIETEANFKALEGEISK